jgi:hypothetical protein
MPILGIMASQISGKLWQPDGAYDALATVTVGATAVASITFAGIPNTYKHLQLRSSLLTASGGQVVRIQFNGNTSSVYAAHSLNGNGTSAAADAVTSQSGGVLFGRVVGTSTTSPTGIITDILDYGSTTKNKVVRSLGGLDANGSGEINLISSLWPNTSAINSIVITTFGGVNFTQYSQFSLFGVK